MSAREAEVRALLRQQRALNAVRRARGRLPRALGDYLRLLASSVVGFGILTALIAWLTPVEPLYLLAAFALLFSVQAASYSVRLARDPERTEGEIAKAARTSIGAVRNARKEMAR